MRCTYVHRDTGRCAQSAAASKTDDHAINLCTEHSEEYDRRLSAWTGEGGGIPEMKAYLGFYVRAQGGAAIAAKRTLSSA